MGDEKFNKDFKNKDADPIVVRISDSSKSEVVQCVKCKGYYVQRNYQRHRRLYCSKSVVENEVNLIGAARAATSNIKDAHPLLMEKIFPYLTKKDQRDVLFNDRCAIIMGNILCEEQLLKPDPADLYKYVSNQLRLLADVFNIARTLSSDIKEIDDMFHADKHEIVIKSIRKRGNFENGLYQNPYPAMQICTILSKLCKKLKSLSVIQNNTEDYDRYEKFEFLLKEQQNTKVTKLAGAARIAHRRKKVEILPTTAEVKRLLEVIDKEFYGAFRAAKNKINSNSYGRLARSILAKIMVINRRRPGDVHKTTISEFRNITTVNEGFLSTLNEGKEKDMASNLCRYVTKGKLNKTMANLITRDVAEAVDYLIEHRAVVGIADSNPYVFANPKAKRAPFFRADEALKIICNEYKLTYDKLKATKLRKHFATTTANLDHDTQLKISKFMGHSFNIHQDIYQIQQIQTDISVMGRILYDASGIYHGDKRLTTEIIENSSGKNYSMNQLPNEHFNDNKSQSQRMTEVFPYKKTIRHEKSESSEESDGSINRTPVKTRQFERNYFSSNEDGEDCINRQGTKNSNLSSPIKDVIKEEKVYSRTWRTPQKRIMRTIFREYLQNGEVPSVHEIQEIFLEQSIQINKSLIQIQSWLRAEIKRNKLQEG